MTYVKEHMRDSLKDHILEEIPAGDKIKAFYTKSPKGGRMMSTLFLFTPEGIVLMGDLCPGGPHNSGSISTFGYGVDWFAGSLSEDYLCSKFLVKEWVPESAIKYVDYEIESLEAQKAQEDAKPGDFEVKLRELKYLKRDLEEKLIESEHEFYDRLIEIDAYYCSDGIPGYDYEPGAAGWLCALQQKFSELYHAKYPIEVKT